MKMNPKAMEAVLRALQKNCLDDMADDKSSPHEKMADAIDDSQDEDDEDPEEEKMENPEEELAEGDEGDEDDEMAKLRKFFKTPPPAARRPGTATMLTIEEDHPKKKKSIRDLMNG